MKILTPENTARHPVHVFLNDEEISNVCFYFEGPDTPFINGEGLVKCYVMDGNVVDVDDEGELKVVEKTGMVRWEPRAAQ